MSVAAIIRRDSFSYRVYAALVCALKIHNKKRKAFEAVAEEFGWKSTKPARRVYDRRIRPKLAAGLRIRDLF